MILQFFLLFVDSISNDITIFTTDYLIRMKKIYIIILLMAFTFGTNAAVGDGRNGDGAIKIIRFYPNPATSVITFEFKNISEPYSIQIYNFLGKKVYSQLVTSNKITIPVDNLYRGLYIYQLKDAFGNTEESGKFQVVR
jgi:hypothetical protein